MIYLTKCCPIKLQNPTYFFNGYAAPPGQNTEEANSLPSAGGAKMTNGGGRIKGRRAVKTSCAVKQNNMVKAPAIVIHPVKVSDGEEV